MIHRGNAEYRKLINSSKWQKLAKKYKKEHPICEICGKELSEEVHHIKTLTHYKDDIDKMTSLCFDEDNLQAVCRDCHWKLHKETKKQSFKRIKENAQKRIEDGKSLFDTFLK